MRTLLIGILMLSGSVAVVGAFTYAPWEKWALLVFLGIDIFSLACDSKAKLFGIRTPWVAGGIAFLVALTAQYWLLPSSPFNMRGIASIFYLSAYVTAFILRAKQRSFQ